MDQPTTWTRSTRCTEGGGNCVEVAALPNGSVAVRDSKDPGAAHLVFSRAEWSAWLDGAKQGQFDRI
jgi:hypothetical protein